MTMKKRLRVALWVSGLVGVFLLALTFTAATLIWNDRRTALADSEGQAMRFVSGAEAALNRTLLGVDVLLASIDELLGLSQLVADWIDPQITSRLMHGAVQQNLTVRFVALVNAQGRVVASSDSSGAQLALQLPAAFLQEVLAQPVAVMTISAPMVSFASSEQVLYMARAIKLADGSKLLAVAEVQVPVLAAILVQGADIVGLEVTLERTNGQLLASVPTQQHAGRQLPLPMELPQDVGRARNLPARLSATPAIVVVRPILYRDVLITASIPIDAALQDWRAQRNFVVGIALLFALMLLAAGGVAGWYMERLALARLAQAQSKATLEQALESMVSGFVLLNAKYQVVHWNRRFEELFPWLADMMTPLMPFVQLLQAMAKQQLPAATEAEQQSWVERRLSQQLNPQGPHERILPNGRFIQITERHTPQGGVVIVYHDVTDLHLATAEIENLAFYDPLTQLPNRRLLLDRLQQATASSERSAQYGLVLFLDLDNFKTLNDTLGHDVGDLLLLQVAQRLKACVRGEDTVARLGGDEFVVMMNNLSDQSQEAAALAQRIGDKLLQQLNQTYQLGAHAYHSTPSIGATLFGPVHQSPADLLKQADIAMYQVKARGRNALCFFDPQMQAAINLRAQLEEDLQAALLDGQFELHYQPQFQLDGCVVGAEVLIRWQHPLRGMVSPIDFIAVAEESELIVSIGRWVLRTACQQLVAWQKEPRWHDLHLSVNVSARQFRQRDFVAQLREVIEETGARPQLLKLELTESLVLDNVDDAIAKMSELKKLGVSFSVDDFGTGQSSLAYLTRLPLDQLKIDQSFVHNIGIQHTDGVIVQTILGMARNLGLEVIAEGVETVAQREFLALHGCTLFQGFLFGKPTALAGYEVLLARQPPCRPS
jgi:diguanylate cyclase (GGDEF)-like protein